MLSPSRFKIHEPLVTGVSPRRTDQRGARKLRNTRGVRLTPATLRELAADIAAGRPVELP
jgi:hypothetical protein